MNPDSWSGSRPLSDIPTSAIAPSDIPLIDIAPLAGDDLAARRAVAARIGAACRDIGFFAITGHGIDSARIDAAFAAARAVFALPLATKAEHAIATLGHNRGYVGLGVEALDEHTAADLKEAWNVIWSDGDPARPGNVWPPIPGWQATVQAYFDAVLAVGRRLHRGFALDLGVAEDHFVDKLDRPMATLRMLRYPGQVPDGAPVGQLGAATHTDYGNVTLLATDGVGGLQVRRRDGQWIDVPTLPGAFVCNIGDCLMRWTNDVYLSTPHRVLPPPALRHSIAFFLDPNPDALVSALPTCVPAGQSPRHPPITGLDYLRSRLDATYAASGAR